MNKLKNKLLEKGYDIVTENEFGISFVNESINYCVILVNEYDEDEKTEIFELSNELQKKYIFAEKGTILLINTIDEKRNEKERNLYFFLKIYSDNFSAIPFRVNKNINIRISPMLDINDLGDYTINPFDDFDGLACQKYLTFLNSVETDVIVKFPKIFEPHYIRYLTNKFFTVNYEK